MSDPVTTRAASSDHLEQILVLAAARRRQYAAYQPLFWRPAPDALDQQRPYLASLLADGKTVAFVAVDGEALRGFAVGRLVSSPPVYDPGGETCFVDDFAVADSKDWATVGVTLLGAVQRAAARRGAAQVVVVTAHLDDAKRSALAASGLTMASEWWVGSGRDLT